MATVRPVSVVDRMAAARADLGLSGEGLGLRGGGVRGTAGFGAMLAAGRRPWMMCFCANETQQRSGGSFLGLGGDTCPGHLGI